MIYRFSDCELDTQRMTLRRAGQTIRPRPKVFQLIAYLLAHGDRVVSKDELCEAIWPEQFIHDATLGSTVRAARHAVGDTGNAQRVIQTRHGHGYRLIAEVEMLLDTPVELAPVDRSPDPPATAAVEVIAPVASVSVPAPPPGGVTQAAILVVDDEAIVVKRLEALLTPRNFKVLSAFSGTAGLEQAQRERPDLILLDVMMPDIDGFEVCRRLKEAPDTQLIPVVLMTALSDVEDRVKGLEAGADDFLTKPVHREELLARIHASLRLKHTIDQKIEAVQYAQTPTVQAPLYLTLTRQDQMLAVDLAAPGATVPRGQLPLSDHMIDEISKELAQIITLGVEQTARCHLEVVLPNAPLLDNTHAALQRLGHLIFSYLLPSPIQQRLAAAESTDLFLRQEDDLVAIPWELTFDGQAFWAAKFRLGRQLLNHQPSSIPPSSEPTPTLHMLIIVDPSEHRPTAVMEAERLCNALRMHDHLDVTILGGKRLRKIDLLFSLGEYDFVHYIGQAVVDFQEPTRSGWVLHDHVLTVSELGQLTHPPILLFANACPNRAALDRPSETICTGHACDMGRAFLQAGTPHYISQFCAPHHPESVAFAADFYCHFLQGVSVGAALSMARQNARQSANRHDILWASFVHYGDPTFQLAFDPSPS